MTFFTIDQEARTVRGMLLPYGQLSRRSVTTEPILFKRGVVEIPEDPTVVSLNRDHSQLHPIGRVTELIDTDKGVEAVFAIARTKDGDTALADIASGKFKRLSAEMRDLKRRGTEAVKAVLTGASLVPEGAFASAALFELAAGEEEEVEDAVEEAAVTVVPELSTEQVTAIAQAVVEQLTNTETNQGSDPQEEGGVHMGAATIPAGVKPPATPTNKSMSAVGLFAALSRARDNSEQLEGTEDLGALFAISTIQHSGPTTVTIGADVQVPQALGELWKRRAYQRKFAPLFNQSSLTSMKARGWRWVDSKEPVVAAYSGNTAEIPSNAVDTEEVTVDAVRIAGGHKLDRRYLDFGDQSIISSYFDHMTESYSRVTDAATLTASIAGSTAMTSTVAPPTGVATGLAAIVDGALAVIAAENTPAFAVVSAELWREIVLTPHDSILGYLSASLGLEEGSTAGFRIMPGTAGTGKVLVGAKEAMTVFELPGVPIRVEGIDPHHGAIDPALFGYYATLVNNAKGLQLVTAYTAG